MGDGTVQDGNGHNILFRVVNPLGDGILYFVCLAEADSDMSVAIADDDDRAEAEAASALYDFRDTVDGYQPVLEIEFTCFDFWHLSTPINNVYLIALLLRSLPGEDSNLY